MAWLSVGLAVSSIRGPEILSAKLKFTNVKDHTFSNSYELEIRVNAMKDDVLSVVLFVLIVRPCAASIVVHTSEPEGRTLLFGAAVS